MKLKHPSLALFFAVAGAIIIADQLTKWLIVWEFVEPNTGKAIVWIPRFLQIIFRENTGAAFSLWPDRPIVLKIVATIVATGLAGWSFRLRGEDLVLRWPLGLILGGAIGNLIDRYRIGRVIDFIDAHWDESYHFPTFNVADSAICVGMGLLIWLSFRSSDPK